MDCKSGSRASHVGGATAGPMDFRPRSVSLRDGRNVTMRAIVPSDASEIRLVFERLSTEARYSLLGQRKMESKAVHLARTTHSARGSEFSVAAAVQTTEGVRIVAERDTWSPRNSILRIRNRRRGRLSRL